MKKVKFSSNFFGKPHRVIIGAPILFIFLIAGNSGIGGSTIIAEIQGNAFLMTGEVSTISLMIDTKEHMNAVRGVVRFSQNVEIISIDTETSILDIWAQPAQLQSDKSGVVFSGGVLSHDGYIGKGELFRIQVRARSTGSVPIRFIEGELLASDGTGRPILFFTKSNTLYIRSPLFPTPDVTGDNKISIDDVTMIYLRTFGQYDKRYDLNNDGKVNWHDVKFVTLMTAEN